MKCTYISSTAKIATSFLNKAVLIGCFVATALSGCDKKLDINPKATISTEETDTEDGAEKLVIAAYAALANDHYDKPFSMWIYGDVRSDDAYKGGASTSDIQDFHYIETFYNTRSDFDEIDGIWYLMYIGISRANAALNAIESVDESSYAEKTHRMAEMRFLRAHWYFQLKLLFKYMPYIDEYVSRDSYDTVGNRSYSNDELWEKIASDFEYAAANLPETKTDVGRPDQAAAYAYLAKTRLYQAYMQDDANNVTTINATYLQEVVDATDQVLANTTYGLESDIAYNFMPGSYENGKESIWAVQYSNDDGTTYGRLNFGDVLSVPQGLGCCDFKKPSQNLVNAYKTDANGLPLLDDFNTTNVDPSTDNIDPRLDHTVAISGRTWKYDETLTYVDSWNRTPGVYGYYASLKENISPNSSEWVHLDPFYGNSKNRIVLRYADVLLMRAEALIELGRQDEALDLVNQLRDRAAASTALLVDADGNAEGNYLVKPYVADTNIDWTQANARKALRFERRLEMAEEGSRFFDLVRWGVADDVMNTYFTTEKTRYSFLSDGYFTQNKHEYLPLPLNQINFSKNLYQQNYGY
ncbi:MAG: RagB/SusD family nutrient uptake outer membrane protein [Chitinophagaceae bacterium]